MAFGSLLCVAAGIRPLHEEVARDAVVAEGAQPLKRIISSLIGRRNLAGRERHSPGRILTYSASELFWAEGRSLRQMRGKFAVVGQRRQQGPLLDGINPLVQARKKQANSSL